MNNTIVLRFDKNTLLLVEVMHCNMPDTVDNETHNIIVTQEQYDYITQNKFLMGYDANTNELIYHPSKPGPFHQWNGTEWVEDTNEKTRVLSGDIRDFRLSLLQRIDDIVKNPFRFESLSAEQKTELSNYRLQLLDIPQQAGFPLDVIWPEVPAILQ